MDTTEQAFKEVAPEMRTLNNCPGTTPGTPMSKNQLKKQRKLAEFAELRKLRREREREKKKQKRREAKELGLPVRTGPSRKELKKRQVAEGGNPQPGNLHFTGIRSNGQIHESFKKNEGWENWHVQYYFDRGHTDVFEKSQMVYLTCESDRVLDKLQPGCTYVIGGLVDHNHFKGLCHSRATAAGLTTARLPLSEHVDMKTRAVLSTYHVFELLTKVAAGQDWTAAILDTIPMRKGAKAKITDKKEGLGQDLELNHNLEQQDKKQEAESEIECYSLDS
ncbi:GD17543 [Drosophila simulans]|uniref:tRNA (guanine(9)-N(1))-methyltransferase n=1 Tax=Drosophila simulans TaxID=7240 RepID=B4R435_DROSI|nr:GD17543 [Drosophila simulans]